MMEWLLQNWIWIVFAVGIFLLMRRGGMACGMGRGRSHDNDTQAHQHQGDAPHADPDRRPKDPVSGEIVNPETAPNSMYQGRVYYFGSRENRDAFEASPAQYAARIGEPNEEHRHHHRHGC
jgi:YHS domain-containing protein